ncbi:MULTISPECIES: hypothetical protein [Thalassospira]|uniref:hypothetical protein n=1 Tax=Thalassospira TaxID=168934 RepID=UPI00080FF5DD|nr:MULTISPECIES: hypothetical protein [Thalassospira]OCK08643.1 hypothetical protein KO164_2822 [Thalassospira sp. KO164]SEE54034.1 hypothetical protein SAMN04515623_2851 [Thalassospira permensis]
MDKLGDWLNSVPLFGIAGISFAVGTLYGKGLPCLEWETLIAGCLGLGGGAFALVAMKSQITANERAREAEINREETLNNDHYYAMIAESADHLRSFAVTTLRTIETDEWYNQSLIKGIKDILVGIPIPSPPLTVHADIRNTAYGMIFTQSKIASILTEVEKDMPTVIKTREANNNISVAPPPLLIEELLTMESFGIFIISEIDEITRSQDT